MPSEDGGRREGGETSSASEVTGGDRGIFTPFLP